MNTQNLINLIKTVAKRRRDVEQAKEEAALVYKLMKETREGKLFQTSTENFVKEQETLTQAEIVLKSAVLEVYKETGEKKPINGVEVDAPVKVKEEAKCTIASDLSSYLKKEE